MYDVLAIVQRIFEGLNTESARIGIIKRKLIPPEPNKDVTLTEFANLIKLQFQVAAKLFRSVLKFGKKHIHSEFQISYYLNMNRLAKAEVDLNELIVESTHLLSEVNFFRL